MKNDKQNIRKSFKLTTLGFTLVELLAVLVILAVILVIAIPKVMGIISDVRKSTLESTAKLIASSAEKKKMENEVIGTDEILTCENVVKINDVDYESCIIEFIDDRAVVTLVGKGNFEGMSICDGTKNDVKISERCLNKAVGVTIELNNGNTIVETYKEGTVLELESPTKENSTFLRFEVVSGNSTLVDNKLTVGSDDTIVYALYESWPSLSINLDGGVSSVDQSGVYKSETVIELVEPTKEGYTFTGWIKESGNGILSGSTLTMGSEDTTLTTSWKSNAYKVSFNANGGTLSTTYKDVVYNETYGEMPIPIKSKYMFIGWYNENDKEVISSDKVEILNDIELTAKYVKSDFEYTGSYEIFTVPKSGYYKLEVWGAQGGSYDEIYYGGYGGYSAGYIYLNKGEELYINVGGKGLFESGYTKGGYNGGGDSTYEVEKYTGSGGGATHISKENGLLSSLSSYANNNNSPILIVAGGGGGASQDSKQENFGIGGSGGGFKGNDGTSEYDETYIGYGGTQQAGGNSKVKNGSFGKGGNASTASSTRGGGGGGGYYGGGSGYKNGAAGGGGSGYIGNINLFDKYMVCFECNISSNDSTKTYSVSSASDKYLSNYPKKGHGAAKITYVNNYESIEYDYTGFETTYTVKTTGVYKLEVWGAQGGSLNTTYYGGYGGYSTGYINLNKGDKLFINVGGKGLFESGFTNGGYNGGGDSTYEVEAYTGSGGGATHIARETGILSSMSTYALNDNSPILIVAGGGGSASQDSDQEHFGIGGSGGGFKGKKGTSDYNNSFMGYGGTQEAGGNSRIESGSFGKGGNASIESNTRGGGGGGGYYGGGSGYKFGAAGGGGSGYIGNNNLFDKYMVCYECDISDSINIKTISNTSKSSKAKADSSKQGNGYAKISFIESK